MTGNLCSVTHFCNISADVEPRKTDSVTNVESRLVGNNSHTIEMEMLDWPTVAGFRDSTFLGKITSLFSYKRQVAGADVKVGY